MRNPIVEMVLRPTILSPQLMLLYWSHGIFMLKWSSGGPQYHLWSDNFDGLVQDCSISSALALEILQPCTKPSMCDVSFCWVRAIGMCHTGQLPWIFPGASLIFNGALGNIQGNLNRYDVLVYNASFALIYWFAGCRASCWWGVRLCQWIWPQKLLY